MISLNLHHISCALMLSLVAGTPLLFCLACLTPIRQKVCFLLPWAAVPAFLTSFFVPTSEVVAVPWFFMGGRMGLDATGRIFLCLSAFIWFLAGISSARVNGRQRYSGFFLAAMAGNFGLILAQDVLGYYLFFALMSFSAYGLVVHDGSRAARKAGRIYLILVMIGEIAIFVSLLMLAGNAESMAIADISGASFNLGILLLLFIGFGVKIGALPVHGWMPPAYQVSPVPAAAALAGAMVNAGLFGWIRFLPLGKIDSPRAGLIFITAGALAAVYGVIVGLGQKKARAVLAYSSISQMGLMTLIFGLGLTSSSVGEEACAVLIVYAVHHGLAKSSLFFGYDVMINRHGQASRWSALALLLPALSLAGLPFTSGAVAKTGLKELSHAVGEPWSMAAQFFLPLAALGTTLLVLHFVFLVQRCGVDDASPFFLKTKMTVWIASLGAVAFTVWLWPKADTLALHSLSAHKIMHSLWPVVLGCLIVLAWKRRTREEVTFDSGRQSPEGGLQWHDFYKQFSKWQKKKETRLIKALGKPAEIFHQMLQLRKMEKVLGRWTMVGVSYLLLCLILLFLLG